MTTLRKNLMIGLLAIGIGAGSATAWAEKGEAGGDRGRHGRAGARMHTPEQMKEMYESRQQRLHDKLKLDAQQDAAWKRYVEAIRPGARQARPDRAEIAKLSAPDRMQKRMEVLKAHEHRLALHIAATRELYAALTPEQQKVFDAETLHGPRAGKHRHRAHHGARGERS